MKLKKRYAQRCLHMRSRRSSFHHDDKTQIVFQHLLYVMNVKKTSNEHLTKIFKRLILGVFVVYNDGILYRPLF